MQPLHRRIHEAGIIRAEGNLSSGDAHIAVDTRRILAEGLDAYIERVKELRHNCDGTRLDGLKKIRFYDAVLIALEALQSFILRYVVLAIKQAEDHNDEARKKELAEISRICGKIAHKPASTFYEALQLTWFIQLVLQIESNGHSLSMGRLDQYLYPYYKPGDDTRTMELLENLWIKLMSVHKIRSWSHTRFSAGSPLYQNVTIGGRNKDGSDATNDLSLLITPVGWGIAADPAQSFGAIPQRHVNGIFE